MSTRPTRDIAAALLFLACALAIAHGAPRVAPPSATEVRLFELKTRKGDSASFCFTCNNVGEIRMNLRWVGAAGSRPCETLTVTLSGPVPEGPMGVGKPAIRLGREVKSPFVESFSVTEKDLLLGKTWVLTVASPRGIGTAKGTLFLGYPFTKSAAERRDFIDLVLSRLEFESLGAAPDGKTCRVNVKVRVRNAGNAKAAKPFTVLLRILPPKPLPPGSRFPPGGKVVTTWELRDVAAGEEKQLSKVLTLYGGLRSVTFEAEVNPVKRRLDEKSYGNNRMQGAWVNPLFR